MDGMLLIGSGVTFIEPAPGAKDAEAVDDGSGPRSGRDNPVFDVRTASGTRSIASGRSSDSKLVVGEIVGRAGISNGPTDEAGALLGELLGRSITPEVLGATGAGFVKSS